MEIIPINLSKSDICFSGGLDGNRDICFSGGLDGNRAAALANRLGVNMVEKHGIYLGIPTNFGRSKTTVFNGLVERIEKKLKDWKSRLLSQAGKLTLIKSIAQSIPTYLMSVFRIPDDTIDKIVSILTHFWWGQKHDERRVCWIAWKKMCRSKAEDGLGIRDFTTFNEAMLAKQSWRIIHNPDSLLSRIYQARYYKNDTFLSAGEGYSPSYTWRSILEGRESLKKGLLWRIGDGQTIKIWNDPWISDGRQSRVRSNRGENAEDMLVRDLPLDDYSGWNETLIYTIFEMEEADRICRLPLRRLNEPDRVFWSGMKNGIYSVKSGYYLSLEVANNLQTGQHEETKWKWVWELKVAPKIRVFIWRCLKEILPVCINLIGRFVDVDPFCKRCGSEPETAEHATKECEGAVQFWQNSPIQTAISGVAHQGEPLSCWIRMVIEKIPKDKHALFVTLLWLLWWDRNKLVFEDKSMGSNFLYAKAVGLVEEFNHANRVLTEPSTNGEINNKWKPPPGGFVKINTDAAVLRGREIGVGGVARNEDGTVLWCFSERVNGFMDVDSAEAYAMLRGIQIALARTSFKIIMESDSQTLIKALRNPRLNLSLFGTVTEDILAYRPSFEEIGFEWIRRTGNSVAHCLAASAFERVEPFCSAVLPNEIEVNVIADLA